MASKKLGIGTSVRNTSTGNGNLNIGSKMSPKQARRAVSALRQGNVSRGRRVKTGRGGQLGGFTTGVGLRQGGLKAASAKGARTGGGKG